MKSEQRLQAVCAVASIDADRALVNDGSVQDLLAEVDRIFGPSVGLAA